MLDAANLTLLKQAAQREDWEAARDVYLELALSVTGTPDSFLIETLAPAIRRRDATGVVAVADQLLMRLRRD